ncbi:unnamed protein product, partial [Closterium sp. NIES-53]
ASKACGPLFSWLEAAVQYGEIIRAVQPMRDEMEQLEGEAGSMAEELQHVQCGMKGSGVRDEMEQLEGEAGSMAEELQHVQGRAAHEGRDGAAGGRGGEHGGGASARAGGCGGCGVMGLLSEWQAYTTLHRSSLLFTFHTTPHCTAPPFISFRSLLDL